MAAASVVADLDRGAGEHLRRRLVATRHVLLEHDVEVGAAEAERADATAPHAARRGRPVAQLRVHRERRGVPVDVRVRVVEVEARREHLVVQAADHLEQAGRAGGGLEVADVRLDRTEGDLVTPGARCPKTSVRLCELGGVADAGRRAVGLDRTTVAGSSPAMRQARSTASRWPIGFGAVMPLPLPSLEPAMPRITA